jgi:hypothetical protein
MSAVRSPKALSLTQPLELVVWWQNYGTAPRACRSFRPQDSSYAFALREGIVLRRLPLHVFASPNWLDKNRPQHHRALGDIGKQGYVQVGPDDPVARRYHNSEFWGKRFATRDGTHGSLARPRAEKCNKVSTNNRSQTDSSFSFGYQRDTVGGKPDACRTFSIPRTVREVGRALKKGCDIHKGLNSIAGSRHRQCD